MPSLHERGLKPGLQVIILPYERDRVPLYVGDHERLNAFFARGLTCLIRLVRYSQDYEGGDLYSLVSVPDDAGGNFQAILQDCIIPILRR